MDTPDDCRRCAACCFSAGPRYVAVTGTDWARLGPDAERLAHFIGHRAYMKMEHGRCTALARRHDAAGLEYGCTVYDRRPQICRDLERGSDQCAGERTAKAALVEALHGGAWAV